MSTLENSLDKYLIDPTSQDVQNLKEDVLKVNVQEASFNARRLIFEAVKSFFWSQRLHEIEFKDRADLIPAEYQKLIWDLLEVPSSSKEEEDWVNASTLSWAYTTRTISSGVIRAFEASAASALSDDEDISLKHLLSVAAMLGRKDIIQRLYKEDRQLLSSMSSDVADEFTLAPRFPILQRLCKHVPTAVEELPAEQTKVSEQWLASEEGRLWVLSDSASFPITPRQYNVQSMRATVLSTEENCSTSQAAPQEAADWTPSSPISSIHTFGQLAVWQDTTVRTVQGLENADPSPSCGFLSRGYRNLSFRTHATVRLVAPDSEELLNTTTGASSSQDLDSSFLHKSFEAAQEEFDLESSRLTIGEDDNTIPDQTLGHADADLHGIIRVKQQWDLELRAGDENDNQLHYAGNMTRHEKHDASGLRRKTVFSVELTLSRP